MFPLLTTVFETPAIVPMHQEIISSRLHSGKRTPPQNRGAAPRSAARAYGNVVEGEGSEGGDEEDTGMMMVRVVRCDESDDRFRLPQ